MSPLNKALAFVGIAVQEDKDTVATDPDFGHGVTGGKVIDIPVEQSTDDLTTGLRAPSHAFRERVAAAADYSTRAWPGSIGAYLYGALGDIDSNPEGATQYKHDIGLGDDIPYLTVFGTYNDDHVEVHCAKIDQLQIRWDGNRPLEVNVTFAGTDFDDDADAYTAAVSEVFDRYFTPIGGTFSVASTGDDPGEALVTGGEIVIANNIEAVFGSGVLTASDVGAGMCVVSTTLNVVVDDLDLWRETLMDEEGLAKAPVTGSFKYEFECEDDTLEISADSVPFTVPFPDADPRGGPVELVLSGEALLAPGEPDTYVSATLINEVESYVQTAS